MLNIWITPVDSSGSDILFAHAVYRWLIQEVYNSKTISSRIKRIETTFESIDLLNGQMSTIDEKLKKKNNLLLSFD